MNDIVDQVTVLLRDLQNPLRLALYEKTKIAKAVVNAKRAALREIRSIIKTDNDYNEIVARSKLVENQFRETVALHMINGRATDRRVQFPFIEIFTTGKTFIQSVCGYYA